ncbi:unnamed protein product [Eretmochelys imbricata]
MGGEHLREGGAARARSLSLSVSEGEVSVPRGFRRRVTRRWMRCPWRRTAAVGPVSVPLRGAPSGSGAGGATPVPPRRDSARRAPQPGPGYRDPSPCQGVSAGAAGRCWAEQIEG